MEWLSQLPNVLEIQVQDAIRRDPLSKKVFQELVTYFTDEENKRRKLSGGGADHDGANGKDASVSGLEELEPSSSVHPDSIIFEIQQISFSSPLRKRMNLTFHLIEQNGQAIPILSIVNPANNAPEVSFVNLQHAVKLCVILPVLGNTTNPQKKCVASLCFWMHDSYYQDVNQSKDPVICQLNLDAIKKQMIKSGKLAADIESQFDLASYKNQVVLNPIQARILDYFKRQFKLCGMNLVSYLPCDTVLKSNYVVNEDTAIAMTLANSTFPCMIMVECHKGARDGNLVFLERNDCNPAYMIFAFKKPILLYTMSSVVRASYLNVTKHTFDIKLVVLNERDEEKSVDFSMIDVAYFQLIGDFLTSHGVTDDSFNEANKEKVDVKSNGGGAGGEPVTIIDDDDVDDDDDEEDDDFEAGGPEEGSDVAEEYDSAAESEPGPPEDGDDVFTKAQED
ncbi:uncharacterized protein LODBEIA_P43180 [Lodderomyces beijingensis]|uniref:Histone chaperone RTT106 n=1 Tax=Lodderomyces beijingensis TaxID=1775926 RepID=A0ABP0ZPM4_9ASCO